MSYINPYELLGINSPSLSDIDSKTILKEKKKLLQEIELSDSESIEHNGIELTKADCLKAVDDLDNKNKREFHFFIFQNKPLNDFLSTGSLIFFENYQIESIYKLPEFLDFVSPYFAAQYDKVLTDNFRKQNIKAVSKILSLKPITNELLFDACYRGTYSIIKGLDIEITDIRKKIELKESPFIEKQFFGLASLIKEKVSTDLINLLPSYFQGLRNQLAHSIRDLARDINNDPYSLYEPAYKIIEIANEFSTDGLARQTITKGYYTIKKNYEDDFSKQTQPSKISTPASHEPVLDEEEPTTSQEPTTNDEPKDNSVSKIFVGFLIAAAGLLVWAFFSSAVQRVILSIATLLYLGWIYNNVMKPENFSKQPKGQVVIYCLSFLVCIGGFFSPILSILFVSYFLIVFLHMFYTSLTSKKFSSSQAGVIYLTLAIVITSIWYNYNQANLKIDLPIVEQENTTPTNNEYSPSQVVADTTASVINNNQTSQSYSTENEPVYTKVLVQNGNISDCLGISPKYDNSIKTKLIISAEFTDVAVKLFDYETDRCIRFVFINDGATYTVKNIPEGKYYLKIAYGNDWSVKEGDPICKGRFTSHASFKKDYDIYDFNIKRLANGNTSTPYYTLKLYRTYSSENSYNSSTGNSISETDFNNN